jgi:uncharacterized membrane protein YphA (DoxX/SURF4 family)
VTTRSTDHADEPNEHKGGSSRRRLPTVGRILMGLIFFVFGLNGFLNFIPQPKTPMPEGAMSFLGALMKTGYMFPLIFGTQAIAGAMLLVNRFVPLALALLVPVIVNIVAFHVVLAPSGIVPAVVVVVLEVYLVWAYRHAYRPLLTMRGTPA